MQEPPVSRAASNHRLVVTCTGIAAERGRGAAPTPGTKLGPRTMRAGDPTAEWAKADPHRMSGGGLNGHRQLEQEWIGKQLLASQSRSPRLASSLSE